MAGESETVRIVIQGTDNLTRPVASASKALGDLERSARGPTVALGNLVTTLGRVGLAAMGVKAIVDSVGALARGMVAGNAQFEQFQVSFTTLLGSAEAARAKLAELEEFAKTTPFTLPGVVTAAQQMLAYGFAADKLTDTLRAVSDATSTFGSEAMPRAIRALGQIQTRGKLASQEMLQLTEVGLPAWQMLADQMGITTAQLQDMTAKGLVPASVAVNGLIDGMRERFGGLSDAQSKTFNGMLSNLEDWSGQAKRILMEPIFDAIKDQVSGLLEYLSGPDVKTSLQQFAHILGAVIKTVLQIIGELRRGWIAIWEQIQSVTSTLGPTIVNTIAVTFGPLLDWWNRFWPKLERVLQSVLQNMQMLWDRHGADIMRQVENVWNGITSIVGQAISIIAEALEFGTDILSGDWKAAWDRMRNIVADIWDVMIDLSQLGINSLIESVATFAKSMGVGLPWKVWEQSIADGVEASKAQFRVLLDAEEDTALTASEIWKRFVDPSSGAAQIRSFLRGLGDGLSSLGQESQSAFGKVKSLMGALSGGTKSIEALDESMGAAGTALKGLTANTGQYIDALVQMSPAATAAAAAVAYLEAEIAAVNLALRANADQLQAAESTMAALRAQLGSLNDQLRKQQQILSELTHPQLVGMRAFSEQIAAVERQLNRLRLAEIGLPSIEDLQREYADTVRTITEGGTAFTVFGISTEEAEAKLQELREQQLAAIMAQYPEMTEEMRAYLSTLPLTEEGLEEILRTLQLTESLSFGEQLQRIREAAEGLARELTFDQAIAGIAQTQANIASLTGQIGVQTAALAAQEGVIASLRAATEALNDTLRTLQEQLRQSEAHQKLVNQALQAAYQWYIDDRQKMREMGEEGVAVADKMDRKTATLLAAIQGMVDGTVTMSRQALAAMVTQYQIDMALAIAEVNGLDAAIRNIPMTWSTTWTIHKYWEDTSLTPEQQQGQGGPWLEGYQHGGSFRIGGSGGPDSQMVAFRATPGERVTITPPGRSANMNEERLAAAIARALSGQSGGRNISQTIITNQRVDAGQSYLSLKAAAGV